MVCEIRPGVTPMTLLMDAILGLVVLEALALALYHRVTGGGIAPRRYLANLAAGFALLLAARLALGGAPSWQLAACLLASLCAHLLDFAGRWDRAATHQKRRTQMDPPFRSDRDTPR